MTDKSERLKAHPFIIDEALATRPDFIDRPRFETIAAIGKRAERFLFSPSASALIGSFVRDCPDLILQHRQFAKPPFAEMYIEFQKPFVDKLPRGGYNRDHATGLLVPSAVGDERIGYLISGARGYVFTYGYDKPGDRSTSTNTPMCCTSAAL